MAKMTPQQYRERWQRGLAQSSDRVISGVNSVNIAPSQQAVAAKPKMVANWNESINSGRWERNTLKFTLQDWKTSMTTKGVQNMQAAASDPRVASRVEQYAVKELAYIDQVKPQIDAMPNITLQDGINRAVKWLQLMAAFDPSA